MAAATRCPTVLFPASSTFPGPQARATGIIRYVLREGLYRYAGVARQAAPAA